MNVSLKKKKHFYVVHIVIFQTNLLEFKTLRRLCQWDVLVVLRELRSVQLLSDFLFSFSCGIHVRDSFSLPIAKGALRNRTRAIVTVHNTLSNKYRQAAMPFTNHKTRKV